MFRKSLNLLLDKGIVIFELILLGVFLFWRYKLSVTRYFDIDEFAHLHWAYSLFIGERPYTDFFYLFPPFFLYVLAPFFAVLGRSAAVLIQTRIFIYLTFLGSALILILLGKKTRGLSFAFLAAIIFFFLPLPQDKMLEIRPDNLALLLALLGLYLFIKGEERREKKYLFLSGLCYVSSLGIVPKTVFFLIPPLAVLIYKFYHHVRSTIKEDLLPLFWGGLPVVLLLFFLIFTYGNPAFSIYSMTRMASNVTIALAIKFYMRPDLFFYKNKIYYGIGGYSLPYLSNLIFYLGASLFAIFRLISSLAHKNNQQCLREFLIGGTFFANLFAFVFLYPLKHAQYLIPVAPFIAFYTADLWESIGNKLPKSLKLLKLDKLITLVFLFFLYFVGQQIYSKKIVLTNKSSLDTTYRILKTIPADEPVFDMTGEAIFYPNGYYFCCVPYGQYQEGLLFTIPKLEKTFSDKKTKYVYTGQYERLSVLPGLQAKYIRENFVDYWPDGSLLIKK